MRKEKSNKVILFALVPKDVSREEAPAYAMRRLIEKSKKRQIQIYGERPRILEIRPAPDALHALYIYALTWELAGIFLFHISDVALGFNMDIRDVHKISVRMRCEFMNYSITTSDAMRLIPSVLFDLKNQHIENKRKYYNWIVGGCRYPYGYIKVDRVRERICKGDSYNYWVTAFEIEYKEEI